MPVTSANTYRTHNKYVNLFNVTTRAFLVAGTRLMLVACMLRLFFAFVFRVALWLFSASLPALIASAFIKEKEMHLVRK